MFSLFFILNLICVYAYISRKSYYMMRTIMINDNTPNIIKNNIRQIICYNYIPLALCESIKIKHKLKIPKYLYHNVDTIIMNKLIDGVNDYDWYNHYYYLTPYIQKCIKL